MSVLWRQRCGIALIGALLLAGCGPSGMATSPPVLATATSNSGRATEVPAAPPAASALSTGTIAASSSTATPSSATPAAATAIRTTAITPARSGATAATGQRVSGDWLDEQPISNWNRPGATIPAAPAPTNFPPGSAAPRCPTQGVAPMNAEQQAVNAAGWTLFRDDQRQTDVAIVWGLASFDGMCRPTQFQAFAFVAGTFTGILSPAPMDSRSDGVISKAEIGSDGRRIVVTYLRYTRTDPACCPSRLSSLTLALDFGAKLVVPVTVNTTLTGTPTRTTP